MGKQAGNLEMWKLPNRKNIIQRIAAFSQPPHSGIDADMDRKCFSIRTQDLRIRVIYDGLNQIVVRKLCK